MANKTILINFDPTLHSLIELNALVKRMKEAAESDYGKDGSKVKFYHTIYPDTLVGLESEERLTITELLSNHGDVTSFYTDIKSEENIQNEVINYAYDNKSLVLFIMETEAGKADAFYRECRRSIAPRRFYTKLTKGEGTPAN